MTTRRTETKAELLAMVLEAENTIPSLFEDLKVAQIRIATLEGEKLALQWAHADLTAATVEHRNNY